MTAGYDEFGVRLEVAGTVATVTLCRPEVRNAQTPRMWAALADIGRELTPEVRVAVLRGEGDSFSAGLDLAMFSPDGVPGDTSFAAMSTLDDHALAETIASFQEAFSWWRRPSLITIAAVQGHAIGAGFQLALACDLRVLADDARMSMRETTLGLVPDLGGTQPLVEQIGYARALELCVTGRWVEASEARELGLATIVVPRADLSSAVADLVAAVSAASADAVTATKALLRGAAKRGYDEQLAAERTAQVKRIRALDDGESHPMSEPVPPWLADFVLPIAPVPRERHGRWDLFDPATNVARPMIVFVHGGPIPADLPAPPRDWPVFRGYGFLAAANGIVGMTVDHRLHDTSDYPTAYQDIRDAIEEARGDDRVDAERIAIWVFSGGGPFVAPLLSEPPDWLRCVAATYPVLDSRPGRDPLPDGFQPVEALGRLGRPIPFVLTTVGLESEPIQFGVTRFANLAAGTALVVEVIQHPTGHHGFDSEDYGAESETSVTEALIRVVRRLTA